MTAQRPASLFGRPLLMLSLAALVSAPVALAGCWPEEPAPLETGSVDLDGDGDPDGDGSVDADSSGGSGGDGSGSSGDGSGASGDGSAVSGDGVDGSPASGDGTDGSGATGDGSTTGSSGSSGNRSSSTGSSTSSSGNRGSSTGSTSSSSGNRGSSTGSTSSSSGGNRGSSSGSTSSSSGSNRGSSSGSTSSSSGGNRGSSSTSGSSSSGSNRGSSSTSGSSSSGASSSGSTGSGSSTAATSGGGSNRGGSGTDSSAGSGTDSTSGGNRGSSTSTSGGSSTDDGSATASGGADNDGISMGMDMPAVDNWDAAPGVRRFSEQEWQSLREERVITVMNEPGPGTDPGCYPRDVMPMAQKGKLTKEQTSCVQASLSKAEFDADKARLSLVLITNSHARNETDNWAWLVQRHLETIDEENPGLAYRYALHLYEGGPEQHANAYRWAGVALGQRAAWTGAVYHERVTRMYKLRSALSQALWRGAEERFAKDPSEDNRDDVLDWREATRKSALEWYRYAEETKMDTTVAYKLCTIASIDEGCEGVDQPG